MHIIQPCCTKKNLSQLREKTDKGATCSYECYGDMSISELLPALMTRYAETDMLIMAPQIPLQAAEAIAREMRRKWSRADGKGKMDEIARLTIITDMSRSEDVASWVRNDSFGGRLTVIDRCQEESIILLPDLAILGFRNMRYSEHFTGTITGDKERIAELWTMCLQTETPAEAQTEEKPAVAETPRQAVKGKRKRPRRKS